MFQKALAVSVFSFVAILASVDGAFAQNQSYLPVSYGAQITHLEVDSQLGLGEKFNGGNLVLDIRQRIATLILEPSFYCPPRRMCAQVMPQPIRIDTRIVSVRKDRCGTITTVARRDDRTRDGLAWEMIVQDNQNNICPVVQGQVLPSTSIVLKTQSIRSARTESSFFAESLRELPVLH